MPKSPIMKKKLNPVAENAEKYRGLYEDLSKRLSTLRSMVDRHSNLHDEDRRRFKNVLLGRDPDHNVNKRRSEEPHYSDNVHVKSLKGGAEYLAVSSNDERGATLYRYIVPGRVDIYSFSYGDGGSLYAHFFSDTNVDMKEGVELLSKDLELPQVQEMLLEFLDNCPLRYGRNVISLLVWINDKAKIIKKLQKKYEKLKAERIAIIKSREAEQQRIANV